MMRPRRLTAVLLLLGAGACAGGDAAPPAEVIATVRVVGPFEPSSGALTACGGGPPQAVAPDSALSRALAALPAGSGGPIVIDVELEPGDATRPARVASVHQVRAGEGAVALCGARRVEADATGHEPEWRAWFAADTLAIVRPGATAPDTVRLAAERLPAVDGTVIYRARLAPAGGVAPVLVVSPAASHRGLREGKVQLAERPEGCRDAMVAAWSNATATLTDERGTHRGCAAYAEPRRDPTARRRR